MAKCIHNWVPVFTPATDANSQSVRVSWIMTGRSYKEYRQCSCGATGSVARGYSKGGGHKMHIHEISDRVWELAKDWNAKVDADLTGN
jgi:hypothetical protein